jgi:quinol monooxygenase YgiN
MDMPWKALGQAEQNREYFALLSFLPLKRYRKIQRFLQFTFQIQRQLSATPGAIGYSLRAKPLSRKFWTLSVWESERALTDFVNKVPHGEVMKALAPYMETTKFTRWEIAGSAIPPNWDDAMRRAEQGS